MFSSSIISTDLHTPFDGFEVKRRKSGVTTIRESDIVPRTFCNRFQARSEPIKRRCLLPCFNFGCPLVHRP